MAKMTENELVAILSEAERQAAIYTGEFMAENTKYLNAYLGEKTGDFAANPNQSSVVSTDIQDVVEADMPSLARIFLGSGDVITFQSNTDNEKELAEAEEKTKYVNWIVRNQPESFQVIHNWLKDAEIQKNGVVKYFLEECKEVEEVEYSGLDAMEIDEVIQSLKGSTVDKVKVEISEQEENEEQQTFDIKFRVTRESEKIRIINIPPESFLITKNATSIDDANLVGDKVTKTRGELLAEGFKRDIIDLLPCSSDLSDSGTRSARFYDQGGSVTDDMTTLSDWANEEVEILDLYAKVDFDGDGIAERRHIMMSGNTVLVNECFNHVPYASLSAILMPHKAIGRSRAEIVYPTQLKKTALERGMMDNIYMVNNPRNVVHPDVDLDDLLTVRVNGIVRMDEDTTIAPQQAIFPLQIPYIGDKTLMTMQYVDQARAQSTGSLLANQGLDADKINKETATRFNGVKDNSDAKIELIARNYAETGFRKLYEGIAWIASRFQNTEQELRVLGKQLTVKPSAWKYNHYITTNVGLGAGNNERLVESLQGVYAIQQQLAAQGSILVDNKDMYNTLKRVIDGLGLPSVQEFFNDPEEPQDLLLRQNELLNQTVVQMQEQMQMLQQAADNPLAEAELVKREGEIAIAQGKLQLQMAELAEKQRQFNIETQQKSQKQDDDVAVKLTEMELKTNKDVPGALV
jgi:hypothetical protein